jgi:glycosyltransferase involved in cell wall biosynthesis
MISIIICSRNLGIDPKLSTNITSTIGCEYELIVIDNSQNKYSIFQAYNIGIEKSTSEIICFVHEDVLFHSKDLMYFSTMSLLIFNSIFDSVIVRVNELDPYFVEPIRAYFNLGCF